MNLKAGDHFSRLALKKNNGNMKHSQTS